MRNDGRQFLLMFLENTNTNLQLELFATSNSQSTVYITVESPKYLDINVGVELQPGVVQSVTFPGSLQMSGSGISAKGIMVTASDDIVVYGLNRGQTSCGGFLAYPINALGYDYYTISWWPPSTKTQLGIVASEDNTIVTVTLPSNRGGLLVNFNGQVYNEGGVITVELDQFGTAQIQANLPGDLTATRIQSNNPVAVFSGNLHTGVPDDMAEVKDNLVEQIPPLQSWGKKYAVVPFPEISTPTAIEIMSQEPTTNVYLNGAPAILLSQAGDSAPQHITRNTFITADKPILVAVYSESPSSNAADDDEPAMLIIPPLEQFKTEYTFPVPHNTETSYLLLVIQDGYQSGLRLDGTYLSEVAWTSFPGSSPLLVGAYITLYSGSHSLTHTAANIPFGANLYGISSTGCGYAYSAGTCLKTTTVSKLLLTLFLY